MVYSTNLKDVVSKNIKGKEKIEDFTYGGHPPRYVNAKHTYLECNACGKKFSLNYKDKKFEEAKLLALKAKWNHAEKEHHHQKEKIFIGEVEVEDDPREGEKDLIETEREIHEEAMKTMDKWYREIISQLQEENKAKEEELKILRNKERELLEIKVEQLSSRIEKLEIQQAQIQIPPK